MIALAGGIVLLSAGCGKQEAPSSSSPAATSSLPSSSSTDTAALPSESRTVADDPTKDGWTTEAMNDRVGERLGILKKWLSEEKPDPAGLQEFIAPGAKVKIRGAGKGEMVFSDGIVLVTSYTGQGMEVSLQPGSLLGMLELHAFSLRKNAHAAIKVTGIEKAADGWRVTLKVQLDEERDGKRRLQFNAVWQTVWTDEAEPRLKFLDCSTWEKVELQRTEPFTDCTTALFAGNDSWAQQLALGTDHWTARIESLLGMDVNGLCGLTLGDINGDGLDDLYLPQQGGLPNRMFLRQPDGSLKDVTAESGTGWLDDCHAALLIDLDNDGDQDLVTGLRDGVLFAENDGKGKFTVRAAKLTPSGPPYGLSAADYDQDGDLDVFAACYYRRQTTASKHYTFARPLPYFDAENGAQDVLLRNDGGWQFTDAARASGIEETKFSYAPSWVDYDDDGDLDLYVANDFGSNRLWRNGRAPEGTVMFEEVAVSAGVEDTAAGMSSVWGDADNDGRMDLYVSNMFSSAGNRIAFQQQFQTSAPEKERALFQRHARGNSLFHNKGDGTFADVSTAAGVTLGRWAWGSRFGDLNNDGLSDLYVANGYITQEDPHDL